MAWPPPDPATQRPCYLIYRGRVIEVFRIEPCPGRPCPGGPDHPDMWVKLVGWVTAAHMNEHEAWLKALR